MPRSGADGKCRAATDWIGRRYRVKFTQRFHQLPKPIKDCIFEKHHSLEAILKINQLNYDFTTDRCNFVLNDDANISVHVHFKLETPGDQSESRIKKELQLKAKRILEQAIRSF